MAGVNKVTILGTLGRDPEVRNFQSGGKVVNLSLATSERYKDREGNQQERTEWHKVAIFNEKLGDIAAKYLRKGNQVYIEGALETRKYTDQQGVEKYSTEIVLRQFRGELTLVGGRGQGGDDAGEAGEAAPRSGGGKSSGKGQGWDAAPPPGGGDDDIPF